MKQSKKQRDAIKELLRVGGMMSNLCYNLGQPSWSAMNDPDKATMRDLCRQWDETTKRLRELQPPTKGQVK